MKARILHTRFWQDEFILSSTKDVRLLYNYLLTNAFIGLTGIYRLPEAYISLETALTKEDIKTAKNTLEKANKVFFYNEWVYIPKADQYNKFSKGEKTGVAYEREVKDLPEDVEKYFNKRYPIHTLYGFSDTLRNKKQETSNKKQDEDVNPDVVIEGLKEKEL